MLDSQQIAKKVGKKLLVTPIDRPNPELAVGIDMEVLGEIPQVDFIRIVAPKLPKVETDQKKNAGEIMMKVLRNIGGADK